MKIGQAIVMGVIVVLTSPLWADPPLSFQNDLSTYTTHLKRSQQALRKSQAGRDREETHQAMSSLQESRQSLMTDIHEGRRLIHNDKTVIGMHKQKMDSAIRYVAQDDVDIKRKEKAISNDSSDSAQNRHER